MNMHEQIRQYLAAQPEPKRRDMQELNPIILEVMPECRFWFIDSKDDAGRTVSDPSIRYGTQTMKYANGKSREIYLIGISANTTGYCMSATRVT